MRKVFIFLSVIALTFVVLLIIFRTYWRAKDFYVSHLYEWKIQPKEITEQNQIDSILATFKKVKYYQLDSTYLNTTRSHIPKYKRLLQNSTYYKVTGRDIYQNIAGHFKIKDFMPKDVFYKKHVLNVKNSKELIWLIDKKLLYRTLELLQLLEKEGYNHKAFTIRNGHRHPAYNEKVGGAKMSRHIKGQAVDIVIGDIDKNGITDDADKQIVLEFLEKKIIGNKGGIGRYPGTKTIHYDVRGKHARWDKM